MISKFHRTFVILQYYFDTIKRLGVRRFLFRIRTRIIIDKILDKFLRKKGITGVTLNELKAESEEALLNIAQRSVQKWPIFLFDEPERAKEQIQIYCPDEIKRLLSHADALISGAYNFFGKSLISEFPPVNWDINPIDDIEWLHALHRHRLVVTSLTKAYILTGQEYYLDNLQLFILSWIDKNPAGTPIAFSPMTISVRLDSWCWMYRLLLATNRFHPGFHRMVTASVAVQVDQLMKKLEFDQCGNHLIYNFYSIFLVGLTMPFLPKAELYRQIGSRGLSEQLYRQFSDDGVHLERTTSYHVQIVRIYVQWIWLLKQNKVSIDKNIEIVVKKAIEVCALFDTSKGIIQFSDVFYSFMDWNIKCDMNAVRWFSASLWDFEWHHPVAEINESVLWQIPISTHKIKNLQETTLSKEKGGFCSIRIRDENQEQLLVFDGGDFGMPHIPGHAHADCLSFVFWVDGDPILADPGTKNYRNTQDSCDYKRTRYHNTLALPGYDQAELWKYMRWCFLPEVRLIQLKDDNGCITIEAEHDGYLRHDRGIHNRKIIYVPWEQILIVDTLKFNRKKSPVIIPYHLGPDVKVNMEKNKAQLYLRDKWVAELFYYCDHVVLKPKLMQYDYYSDYCLKRKATKLELNTDFFDEKGPIISCLRLDDMVTLNLEVSLLS